MMADLAQSKIRIKKKLDMRVGDVVCFEGDHILRAGVGIVMSADFSKADYCDSKGEEYLVLVFWIERGKAMWMKSREISPLSMKKGK